MLYYNANHTVEIKSLQATSGFEMCFATGSQHLGCRVPTFPNKTRLESRTMWFLFFSSGDEPAAETRRGSVVGTITHRSPSISHSAPLSFFSNLSNRHIIDSRFSKWCHTLDLRYVLLSDPSTLGAGAKARLESRIKKFTPHCVCRPVNGIL